MIKIIRTELTETTVKVSLSNDTQFEFVLYQDGKIWINGSFVDITEAERKAANTCLLKYKRSE